MKKSLYMILIMLLSLGTPLIAADEDEGDEPSGIQQKLMGLGFQVFREPVKAPDFTLKNLDGDDVSLSSFQGKLVFLNFWATWCGPCRIEMPSMQAMYASLKKYDFDILAVDLQESERTVKNFIEEEGFTFPVVLDRNGKVGAQYGTRSIPTTYLIDKQGNAIAFLVGSRQWDEIDVYDAFMEILEVGIQGDPGD